MVGRQHIRELRTVIILGFLLLSLPSPITWIFAASCPCSFDTNEYSAVAKGEGYCSATTKDGKDCTVLFNGNVEPTSKVETSSIYGPPQKYLPQLKAANIEFFSSSTYMLMAQRSDWVVQNLPLMIRSSYAGAPFLEHHEKERLDRALNVFFEKYDGGIGASLLGKQPPISTDNFKVIKGRIELNVEGILVIFDTSRAP